MRMRFFLFLRLNTVFELLFPSGVSSLRGVQIVPLSELCSKFSCHQRSDIFIWLCHNKWLIFDEK